MTRLFNYLCDVLLVLLIIGVLLSNFFWLKLDQYPAEGHDLLGIIPAVQGYQELLGMRNNRKLYDHLLGIYNFRLAYPPLSFLVLILFYLLFGLQGQMVVMVNSLYIAITLVCVYLIAKHIFNRPVGLLACFILSSFPGFIAFSRVYWIEFGLMAYVCLDLYLLLKINLFENRKFSLLLGISLALSFLHKPEFIPFILGPFLLVIFKSQIPKDLFKLRWSNPLKNLTLTLGFSLILTSFWWVRYGWEYLGRAFFASSYSEDIDRITKILSLYSLTFYLKAISILIGAIYLGLFFLSLSFASLKVLIKKQRWFYLLYLLLWPLLAYMVFTFSTTKTVPHILSLLPAMAIIISASIYFLKNKFAKAVVGGLIFLYGLNIHISSFSPIKILDDFNYYTAGLKPYPDNFWIQTCGIPRKEKLEAAIKDILEFIELDAQDIHRSRVLVVFKRLAFKNCIFGYYSLLGDYPELFFTYYYKHVTDLSECDFIVLEVAKGETIEEIISRDYEIIDLERRNLKKIFKDGLKNFVLVNTYKMPDGQTTMLIYKRTTNS